MEAKEKSSQGSPTEYIEIVKQKGRLSRHDLLDYADSVFKLAFEKIYQKNTSAPDKLGWARIINGTIASVSPVLRDTEVDQLRADVEAIKAKLGKV